MSSSPEPTSSVPPERRGRRKRRLSSDQEPEDEVKVKVEVKEEPLDTGYDAACSPPSVYRSGARERAAQRNRSVSPCVFRSDAGERAAQRNRSVSPCVFRSDARERAAQRNRSVSPCVYRSDARERAAQRNRSINSPPSRRGPPYSTREVQLRVGLILDPRLKTHSRRHVLRVQKLKVMLSGDESALISELRRAFPIIKDKPFDLCTVDRQNNIRLIRQRPWTTEALRMLNENKRSAVYILPKKKIANPDDDDDEELESEESESEGELCRYCQKQVPPEHLKVHMLSCKHSPKVELRVGLILYPGLKTFSHQHALRVQKLMLSGDESVLVSELRRAFPIIGDKPFDLCTVDAQRNINIIKLKPWTSEALRTVNENRRSAVYILPKENITFPDEVKVEGEESQSKAPSVRTDADGEELEREESEAAHSDSELCRYCQKQVPRHSVRVHMLSCGQRTSLRDRVMRTTRQPMLEAKCTKVQLRVGLIMDPSLKKYKHQHALRIQKIKVKLSRDESALVSELRRAFPIIGDKPFDLCTVDTQRNIHLITQKPWTSEALRMLNDNKRSAVYILPKKKITNPDDEELDSEESESVQTNPDDEEMECEDSEVVTGHAGSESLEKRRNITAGRDAERNRSLEINRERNSPSGHLPSRRSAVSSTPHPFAPPPPPATETPHGSSASSSTSSYPPPLALSPQRRLSPPTLAAWPSPPPPAPRAPTLAQTPLAPPPPVSTGSLMPSSSPTSTPPEPRKRDLRTILSTLLMNVDLKSRPPSANSVNVVRADVLGSAFRAFRRGTFNPRFKLDVVFVDQLGRGGGAVDLGGTTREFLTLLMKSLVNSSFFVGPSGSKSLALDSVALSRGRYKAIGAIISVCVVHGGVGPRVFSQRLLCQLTGRPAPPGDMSQLDDQELRAELQKIQQAGGVEEARAAVGEAHKLSSLLGGRSIVIQTQRDGAELVRSSLDFYLDGRLSLPLQQLRDGMEQLGVLQALRDSPALQRLFVGAPPSGGPPAPLTAPVVKDLFQVVYSVEDGRRSAEERAVGYWRDWLYDIEGGEAVLHADGEQRQHPVRVNLEDVLRFATGAETLPPLGFRGQPALDFLHQRDPLDHQGRVFPHDPLDHQRGFPYDPLDHQRVFPEDPLDHQRGVFPHDPLDQQRGVFPQYDPLDHQRRGFPHDDPLDHQRRVFPQYDPLDHQRRGFPDDPLDHQRRGFPEADAHALILRLPLHASYEDFSDHMISGIVRSLKPGTAPPEGRYPTMCHNVGGAVYRA